MFRIHMLAAEHGDCLWVEYGDADQPRLLLIDAGTIGTWQRLKKKIEDEKARRGTKTLRFEAFVVTHVDADHVGGAVKLMEEVGPLGLAFGDVWFNGYHHLSDYAGGKMGEQLSALMTSWGLTWNGAFGGDRVAVAESGALPVKRVNGMKLTLLSPTPEKLQKLLPKWTTEVRKAGLIPGDAYEAVDHLSGGGSDPELDGLTVEELAEVKFKDDSAEANGSSIAFLAEHHGKAVLFGADAHATVLCESLGRMREPPAMLDAFKVSHHGSRNNTSKELVQLVPAKSYLISTNGNQFSHPHAEAMARIAVYGPPECDVVFNCPSDFNAAWRDAKRAKAWNYRVRCGQGDGGVVVDV